jgi:hypothetical protein
MCLMSNRGRFGVQRIARSLARNTGIGCAAFPHGKVHHVHGFGKSDAGDRWASGARIPSVSGGVYEDLLILV